MLSVKLITKSNLAKLAGVTRQAIQKAVNTNRVPIIGKGRGAMVDLDNALVINYISESKKRGLPEMEKPRSVTIEEVILPTEKIEPVIDEPAPGMSDIPINPNQIKMISKVDLEVIKLQVQIEQIRVRTDKERGDLFSRELAIKVFSKIFAVHQNEFKTLSDKLTPEMAAIFGIDKKDKLIKIQELIETESSKVLKHIQRLISNFFIEIEAEWTDGQ